MVLMPGQAACRYFQALVAGGLCFVLAGFARAGDDKQPEQLPAPRNAAPEIILPPPGPNPMYMRRSAYDVWQHYAVDRYGYFRPRVILAPYGAYYLYNGEPYPWVSTHQLDFMPYVVD
jgi:hypothetical protein